MSASFLTEYSLSLSKIGFAIFGQIENGKFGVGDIFYFNDDLNEEIKFLEMADGKDDSGKHKSYFVIGFGSFPEEKINMIQNELEKKNQFIIKQHARS